MLRVELVFSVLLMGCSPYSRYFYFELENAFQVDAQEPTFTPKLYQHKYDDSAPGSWLFTDGAPEEEQPGECDYSERWESWPINRVNLDFLYDDPLENRHYIFDPKSNEEELTLSITRPTTTDPVAVEQLLTTAQNGREHQAELVVVRLQQENDRVSVKYYARTVDGVELRGEYQGLKELLLFDSCLGCGD